MGSTPCFAKTNTSASNKNDQETLDFWKKTLKYGTTVQKEDIINAIKAGKIPAGEDLILEYLRNEKNENIQKMMISTLVTFSNIKVVSFLLEMIKESRNDDIKIFSFSQLSALNYKDSYKTIMEYLNSKNELLVEAALTALGDMEVAEVCDKLLEKLEMEKSERLRTQIILTLAKIKLEKTQNKLLSIFTNKEEKEINRSYAATGLGYIKNRSSYDALTGHYNDGSVNIKMRIIDALGNLGYKEAVDVLIESLKDDEKNIRIFGIKALRKLKAVSAVDILKYKQEYDPDVKVRQEAKTALEELQGVK